MAPMACRVMWCSFLLLLAALPAAAASTALDLRSSTILRYFERDVDQSKDNQILPAYEYLEINAGNGEPWSFHGYGWMRANLGDNFFEDETKGELLYAYAQYRDQGTQLRLGRQAVYEGVANETVDGAWGRVEFDSNFSLSAYVGLPVTVDTSNGRQGDGLVGGRFSFHRLGWFDLGLSYKLLASESDRDEELLGFDLSAELPGEILVSGLTTRNLVSNGWGEHSYEARFTLGEIELRPFFQRYSGEDFYNGRNNSANPFRFYSRFGTRTTVVGSEAFWYPTENYEFALRLKHFEYNQRFGNADLLSGIFTYKYRIHNQLGLELGRMQGDTEENRYSLARGFFYLDLPPGFLSGDLMYVGYDEPLYGEDRSWFISLGGGCKFLGDRLTLRLSGDYSIDPYFDHDFRAMVVADYRFSR